MKFYSFQLLLLIFGSSYLQANISIVTNTLPNGTLNTPYNAVVSTTSGCSHATWAITSGTLPAGIAIKTSNKPISLSLAGTPTRASTYTFTIKVTGCGGGTSTKSYTLTVQAAPNHTVDLSWRASTSNDVAGYNVFRSSDGATWKQVNANLIASTLYTDSTVSNSSTYYYTATAVDIYGHESSKTPAVKVTIP